MLIWKRSMFCVDDIHDYVFNDTNLQDFIMNYIILLKNPAYAG